MDTLEFPVIGSPVQNLKKADRRTGNSDPGPRRHFQKEVFRTKMNTKLSYDNIGINFSLIRELVLLPQTKCGN